ncbi:DgyrCDS4343 [Dimorphilus gyrociliatus]|uniref:DgyrCDS4343 n=1 Tax=Dimorphilus gyrociliatus TaxID=2664684 RepID=A0A7I8VGQ5_9ANNE|nr:DgyrCDS4343 [Dimorphilus gyrociliatus]
MDVAKKILILSILCMSMTYYLEIETPLTQSVLSWKKRGHYFKYKEHSIYFLKQTNDSPKTKSSLVLLHGFPSFSYDWAKLLKNLENYDKFEDIITFDFIGYGLSDKPRNHLYSIFEQANITDALIKHLKLKNVHILAHDYGDTVAQELLARWNKNEVTDWNLQSVCLSNGGIFPETNFPRPTQKLLRLPYLGSFLSKLMFYGAFRRGFSEVFGPKTQPTEEEFQDYWSAIRQQAGEAISYRLLHYISERQENKERWTNALVSSKVPLHVIYGPADPVNPRGFIEFYKNTVPNSEVTVLRDHISHYPQVEDVEAFSEAFKNFLNSQ